MKVCLLNDSFPPLLDGIVTVVKNYAEIMTETGKARVMVGVPEYPNTDYSIYPYPVIPYKSFKLPEVADGYRAGNPLAMKAISEMAQFQPDIIHVHCPAVSAIMGRILRNETNAPVIFTYHTKYDVDIARAMKSEKIRKEAIKAMVTNISACDEVWTVSHGAGDNLRSLGYEGDIRVVSNGVDFAKGIADADFVQDTVKEYDLPENVPMFLFVGRIIKYKGLPLIIDAMQELSENGMDYRMVFIGSGVDAPELQQTLREYGISLDIRQQDSTISSEKGNQKAGKVIFTGPVYDRERLRAWNTRADLFLFPSTYDTNGIVVREAAACGLASVLIDGSCAAEGITHGRNGYTVAETSGSMARLLMELSKNPDKMRQVGQNAMNEIYISWNDSVMQALDRYQVVLEMKHAGKLKPRRNGKSDKFLNMTTDVMDAFYDVFQFPKAVKSGIQDGITGNRLNWQENLSGMQENFAEAEEYLKKKRQEFQSNLQEFHENVTEKRDELLDEWTEKGNEFHKNVVEVREELLEKWTGSKK